MMNNRVRKHLSTANGYAAAEAATPTAKRPASPALPPLLMTTREAAKYLAIGQRKLWALTQTREIRAVRIGRLVRYDPRDLLAYVDGLRTDLP